MHILIADDDPITRLLLKSILSALGHTVSEAADGEEAWEMWKRERQPLIISDWLMPRADGLELCRRVRAESSAEFTYILLLTARSGNAHYVEAIDAGADDFATKPLDQQRLGARIRVAERLLRVHESLRAANEALEERVATRTAALANALRVKSEFLSRASHELRTPMNHILGFAQLLELSDLTADQADSTRQILASGNHLLQLIDRLLDVAKERSPDLSFLASGRADTNTRARPS